MRFENTVRGASSATTSDSGSLISGRSQMNCGLYTIDSPVSPGYGRCGKHDQGPHGGPPTGVEMKTVLITGCSSGYGLETARHFHSQGWNVVATMRTPRADILPRSDRLRVLPLDVTEPQSIAATIEASGPLDVLVNN